jgi:KDO2-lipid IV(A) lauroyltransferase
MISPGSRGNLFRTSLAVFRNYGRYTVDFIRYSRYDAGQLAAMVREFNGRENLEEALAAGQGVILVTAHLGNWELGGSALSGLGYDVTVLTLGRDLPEINRFRSEYRAQTRIETITIDESPLSVIPVLHALRRKRIVAMLVDRYDKPDGIPTKLFGKPALFPPGPILLARMSGAPIMPSIVVKTGPDRYRAVAETPIFVPSEGDHEANARRCAQEIFGIFERYIAKYPDQWYNFVPLYREDLIP